MCHSVLLIVPVLQRYIDAQVVVSWHHADASTGELRAELVVAPRDDSLSRTLDKICGNWRVMGGLFGDVDYFERATRLRCDTGGAASRLAGGLPQGFARIGGERW